MTPHEEAFRLREARGSGCRRRCRSVAVGGAIGLVWSSLGCTPADSSSSSVDAWRGAASRAIVEVRAADPVTADELSQLAAAAEAEQAGLRGRRLGRSRAQAVAASAWNRLMVASARAVAEIHAARELDEQRLREMMDGATAEVEKAETRATAAGGGRATARAAAGARLRLEIGRRLAAAGDRAGALEALEAAIADADVAQSAWRRDQDRLTDPGLRIVWNRHVREAIDSSRRGSGVSLLVDKARRRLTLYRRGKAVRVFDVEIGSAGLAPKRQAGDRATPEGHYRVVEVKRGAATRYHGALLLDYPNADDRRRFADRAREGLVPRGVGIGSLIEIHGDGGRGRDWTEGCVALTNEDIDGLLRVVGVGTPVTIVGTVP